MTARQAAVLMIGLGLACGRSQAIDATRPVGSVEAVAGDVTAARGAQAPRKLAVKSEVWSDDTVTTAAGSSVGIRLAHNGVLWSLEGGQSRRVDTSLAWKAPRSEAGVLDRAHIDRTAAAGRHAEQEAGETGGTAAQREEEDREAAEEQARREAVAREQAAAAQSDAERQAAREKLKRLQREQRELRDRKPPPSKDDKSGGGSAPKGGAPSGIVVDVIVPPADGRDASGYQRVVRARRSGCEGCLAAAGSTPIVLGVSVAADGSVASVKVISGVDADSALAGCLRDVLRGASFPASGELVEIRVRIAAR